MQQPSVRAKKARLATSRAIVTYLPIAAIVPDPSNPRKHSPEQVRAIANSIEAFGFNAPILIDKESRIVAGQGRLEAARLLGFEEVPAIRLEHLSEQQAKAYTLADNKLTDRSSWDDRKVAIVLKELSRSRSISKLRRPFRTARDRPPDSVSRTAGRIHGLGGRI
jgi:ParB/RepB/Spo0J family partition protein